MDNPYVCMQVLHRRQQLSDDRTQISLWQGRATECKHVGKRRCVNEGIQLERAAAQRVDQHCSWNEERQITWHHAWRLLLVAKLGPLFMLLVISPP